MTVRSMNVRERAARALCRLNGHPENIQFEGSPMWMSYLDQVEAVFAEVRKEIDSHKAYANSADRVDVGRRDMANQLEAAFRQ